VAFPNPLLTPPNSAGFGNNDWLPAVLESILLAYAHANSAPVMGSLAPYRALRSVYDSGAGPSVGLAGLAAVDRLAAWLGSGRSPSGGESFVAGAGAASSPEERAELAKEWLARTRRIVGAHYMPAGLDGAPGGGKFSSVETRAQAAEMPFFCQVARDAWNALAELPGLVDQALALARRQADGPGVRPGGDDLDELDEVF
jgi:hypothetical protein